MPEHEVVDICVDKFESHQALESAGLKVPRNILLNNENDLTTAFRRLGDETGRVGFGFVTLASVVVGKGLLRLPTLDLLLLGFLTIGDGVNSQPPKCSLKELLPGLQFCTRVYWLLLSQEKDAAGFTVTAVFQGSRG